MDIYIAGKITDNPNYKKEFAEAAAALQRKGHRVFNPATIPERKGWTWDDYMQESDKMQVVCQAVYFLPTWQDSKGAKQEMVKAHSYAQKIYYSLDDVPDLFRRKE